MKKVLTIMLAVVFAATSLSAQMAMSKKSHKKMTHCYSMKDGSLMKCMGTSTMPQTTDVTLKNGTMISPSGEVTMKDGTKQTLADGQCISMMGKIGDCDKMHMKGKSKMKMKGDKMKEKMKEDSKK